MTPENTPKHSKKFICESCDFKCCKNSDFNRHLLTSKHLKRTNASNLLDNASVKIAATYNQKFNCACGNYYSHGSSYYRHKKKCNYEKQTNKETEFKNIIDNKENKENKENKDEIINLLLAQNKELIDLIKSGIINNNINNNNNNNNINNTTNNKTFNLHFFLNETCKDAMNITDFVSSIKMDLDDLEHTGRTGYVEGISNIVIKNLNKLEHHMRPLHCSDFKREVLYIKDNNEWTKECDEKPILTKAIKTIANENIKQISKWKDNYPDCTKSHSKKNDLYLKIVSNSMNGLTKEESVKNINKIITNLAKKVIIEK